MVLNQSKVKEFFMNENTDGAPDTLSPTPEATPVEQTPAPEAPTAAETTVTEVTTAETATAEPSVAETTAETTVAETTTPEAAAAAVVAEAPKKKSKGGLIAALIVIFLALVGGGVAAAIMVLKPFGTRDAVPAAVAKLFSSERPKNVTANGQVTISLDDNSLGLSAFKVNINSGINTTTSENSTSVALTLTLADDTDLTLNADEMYTSGGDLYLKVAGITDFLEDYVDYYQRGTIVDCNDGKYYNDDMDCSALSGYDPTVETLNGIMDSLEFIDDEWIKISSSDFGGIASMFSGNDTQTQCLLDTAEKIESYGISLSDIYNENPFIVSSTENLKIAQKKNQLYLINFDAANATGFINSIANSAFTKKMLDCVGTSATSSNVSVKASDVQKLIDMFPVIYAEIDGNNNFTRLYLAYGDDSYDAVIDLDFEYPSSITVSEPSKSIDLNTLLQQLLVTNYNQNVSL